MAISVDHPGQLSVNIFQQFIAITRIPSGIAVSELILAEAAVAAEYDVSHAHASWTATAKLSGSDVRLP